MAGGVYNDERGWVRRGGMDAEDFASRVRRLAPVARRVLDGPDGSLDDLIGLHRTVWELLRATPGAPSSEVHRWLLAVHRAIVVKVQSRSVEELESLAC
jgi:hypothetical protein